MLRRRLIPLFLAALAALVLGASGAASASAQTTAEAKTRVGVFDPAAEAHVGGQAVEKPSTRRGTTTLSTGIAAGYLVAARGGAGPVRAGQAGERAAGITKNTRPIESAVNPGRTRVPDVLDPTNRVLGEVKNVGYQPYSRQLRDYAAIAQREGYRFDLYVRRSTRLSGPLGDAARRGDVSLRYLP